LEGITRRWASGIPDELSGVAEDAGRAREVADGVDDARVADDFGSSEEPQALARIRTTVRTTV